MTDLVEGPLNSVGDPDRNAKARGHVPGDASMWFFVIGDLFIFGVYFVGYMYYRGQDRPCSWRARRG